MVVMAQSFLQNKKIKTMQTLSKTYPYCEIKDEQLILNGNIILHEEGAGFAKFIKSAYSLMNLDYPKFHKMDRLCKLAFVAAYALVGEDGFQGYAPEEIGVVMANAHSTLHTDSKHEESIQDRNNYYPSPAVFVYTLPNIMVGEIAIKYNIKGESVFFVSNEFDKDLLLEYSQDMLADGSAKICLTGWVDYTENGYHAVLFLVK